MRTPQGEALSEFERIFGRGRRLDDKIAKLLQSATEDPFDDNIRLMYQKKSSQTILFMITFGVFNQKFYGIL